MNTIATTPIPVTPETVLVLLLGIFILLLFFLIGVALYNNRQIRKVAYPAYEYALKRAQKEAQEIVRRAMDDARKLRVDAELAGLKTVAKEKLETREIEERYKKSLDELAEETRNALQKYSGDIEASFSKLSEATDEAITAKLPAIRDELSAAHERIVASLKELEKSLGDTNKEYHDFTASIEELVREEFEKNRDAIRKEVSKLPERFSEALEKLEEESAAAVKEGVDAELESAKKRVEAYRRDSMLFIDSAILDLVERSASIALEKGFSADEHADIIYRSLEEAKKSGVFKKP